MLWEARTAECTIRVEADFFRIWRGDAYFFQVIPRAGCMRAAAHREVAFVKSPVSVNQINTGN